MVFAAEETGSKSKKSPKAIIDAKVVVSSV